ncbi:MAG: hypothetical protein FJ267_06650, partial [Planctomycetes bacterium]|nr:hypothetical protein [Planctomycetota bacterium]
GSCNFPKDLDEQQRHWDRWTRDYQSTTDEIHFLWPLYGMRTGEILRTVATERADTVSDTPITRRVVEWVIENEWVTTLDDLIERRLMLVFSPNLTTGTLRDLAQSFITKGRLEESEIEATIDETKKRLSHHYGRTLP